MGGKTNQRRNDSQEDARDQMTAILRATYVMAKPLCFVELPEGPSELRDISLCYKGYEESRMH